MVHATLSSSRASSVPGRPVLVSLAAAAAAADDGGGAAAACKAVLRRIGSDAMLGWQASLLALALLRGVDGDPAQARLDGMSLRIEPEMVCPKSQFNVIWEKEQATVEHWLGVFLDHKLLYWCYLDGSQTKPLGLGDSTGVGLMIGTAGTYNVHYFATPRPQGTTPVLMQDAIGEARVTISPTACFEVQLSPATSCELDPFELSWKIPVGRLGEGDRIGIFRAEDGGGGAVAGLPPPPPPPALHWVPVPEATGKQVLRIGKPGQYEARFFFGAAPTVPDFVSERIQVLHTRIPSPLISTYKPNKSLDLGCRSYSARSLGVATTLGSPTARPHPVLQRSLGLRRPGRRHTQHRRRTREAPCLRR